MRLKILTDREAILAPISGGVCPVGGVGAPVSEPPTNPPGEPHLIGASAGLTASLWVSGALLRFRSGDGNEYGETGAALGASPGSLPRSLRYVGEEIEYMDDSGVSRRVSKTSLGAKAGGVLTGAIRYDATQPASKRVTFAGATNHYQWSNGF